MRWALLLLLPVAAAVLVFTSTFTVETSTPPAPTLALQPVPYETLPPDTAPAPSTSTTTAAPAPPFRPGRGPVGTVHQLPAGGLARVNLVREGARPASDFSQPSPRHTITRVVVELCAGSDLLNVNPAWWTAVTADGDTVEQVFALNGLVVVGLAPGGCTRGFVDFDVPRRADVARVVLTGPLGDEWARWSTRRSIEADGPLTASSDGTIVSIGLPIVIGDGDATGRPIEVRHDVAPTLSFFTPLPGWTMVEVELEICAGSERFSVNPGHWMVTARDNTTGQWSAGNGTLQPVDLSPGDCTSGTVQIELPAGARIRDVIATDALYDEVMRWRVT